MPILIVLSAGASAVREMRAARLLTWTLARYTYSGWNDPGGRLA